VGWRAVEGNWRKSAKELEKEGLGLHSFRFMTAAEELLDTQFMNS
jgi:hypothetical protein